MKKTTIILSFCVVLLGLCACGKEKTSENNQLFSDKIYYFYQKTCSHCHDAQKYIDKKYPDLEIEKINIAVSGNYELFVRCAQKFDLGNRIGTPLFCMGKNYLMGWSPEAERKFDIYVKPFINR